MHAGKLVTRLNETNHGRCLLSVITSYPSFEKCSYSDNVIPAQIEACMPYHIQMVLLGALVAVTALHFRGLRNGVAWRSLV